jgi:signal transduction histidine kinase
MKFDLERGRERPMGGALRASEELECRFASATAAFEEQNDHLQQKADDLRRTASLAADMLGRVSAERMRFRFLAETSALLSASLDDETTLTSLSRVLVPTLADGCGIFLAEGSAIRCVATAHASPAKEPILSALAEAFCKDTSAPENLIAQAIRDKRPIALRRPAIERSTSAFACDPEARELLSALTLRWAMAFPFISRARVLGGVVLFGTHTARDCDEVDRGLVQEIASRAAIAIDNALLYREAQRAITARENLMAIVSHDLRNSLSLAMMGSTVLETALMQDEPRARVQQRVGSIHKGLGKMRRLIEDLLDFSSLEAGHLSLVCKEHDVASLLSEAIEAFQVTASAKAIHLEGRCVGSSCRVVCDRDRVLQVIANVMGNALKFTPSGGAVTLRARAGGDDVEFSVADTGCGIPSAELPRVFEAYFRTSRPKNGGTGLGLFIAKGVVESHGGHMWVESRAGEGTTFHFSLPRRSFARDDDATTKPESAFTA